MIEEYRFGSITIDGKTYNHDVEVRWTPKDLAPDAGTGPTGQALEVLKWWRKESHIIDAGDITRAVNQNPDMIIIGTGESGIAKVTEGAKNEIRSRGIELIIDLTDQAIKTFNIRKGESGGEQKKEKIIGLFHLTC